MAAVVAYSPSVGPQPVMKALEFKATEQMVHVVGEKSTREGTIISVRYGCSLMVANIL